MRRSIDSDGLVDEIITELIGYGQYWKIWLQIIMRFEVHVWIM